MNIGFVYDVLENVFGATDEGGVLEELSTELFSATQANAIILALKELGHRVIVIDGAKAFVDSAAFYRSELDFVFNEAKGLFGPDRKMVVPALCRIFEIPYLGSDAYAVTLARNKWHTLAIAAMSGLEIPRSQLYESCEQSAFIAWNTFPAIVKPNFESSSIGITDASVVASRDDLVRQTREVIDRYQQPALVQEFIPGTEVQVSCIGTYEPLPLGVTAVRRKNAEDATVAVVRNSDWDNEEVVIEPYSDPVTGPAATAKARRLYRALGIRDYGRIDFRVTTDGRPLFIEAATHPHITPDSSFSIAASAHGWSFVQMIDALLAAALDRQAATGDRRQSR